MVKTMFIENSGVDWLLQENESSVRYRTLTELLDVSPDTPQARRAKAQIHASKLEGCLRADTARKQPSLTPPHQRQIVCEELNDDKRR